MSADQKKGNADNKKKNNPIAEAIKSLENIIRTNSNTTAGIKENERTENIQSEQQNKRRENKNFILQVVLAFFTILLFGLTSVQTYISSEAVKRADTANDLTKRALKLAEQNAISDSIRQHYIDSVNRIKDRITSIKDSILISLSDKSVQNQSAILNESRKQFDYESRPYLQIGDFEKPTFEKIGADNTTLNFHFRFINFGKLPANISKVEIGNRFMPVNLERSKIIDSVKGYKFQGIYYPNVTLTNVLSGGYNVQFGADQLWDATVRNLSENAMCYIFYGVASYTNAISNVKYSFKFIYKINLKPYTIDIIENKIMDN